MHPSAGLAFKPQHFDAAMAAPADGLWFEVHAENYMVEGGPRLAMLAALRADRPIALHGVGLSLGGAERPDMEHLARLATLAGMIDPTLVSEHLAWSRAGDRYLPDLLPVQRTTEALRNAARNIGIVQDALGRPILIEHPAHYLALDHDWPEPEFLAELVRRSGCRLLVDVNNVSVGAHNLGGDPCAWLAALPHEAIGEIHIAGHSVDPDPALDLLIDSHDAPVSEDVWELLGELLAMTGPRPVLLERDAKIPRFEDLLAERGRAAAMMKKTTIAREEYEHA